MSKLYKLGKDIIIHTVENIILNWLICVSICNLQNHFIREDFSTVYSVEYLWGFQQRTSCGT